MKKYAILFFVLCLVIAAATETPEEIYSVEKIGSGEGAITVLSKQGVLPVKLEIPNLGKSFTIEEHLITKENQPEIKILIVRNYFAWLFYFVSFLFGLKVKREAMGN